ncbi:ABC transporter, substrate-binding protein (cluster 12, methionine/phosphonates) [hydrothermal vent metagenome]|uniref:ABC transporter, substrate-binding protein (Cluster 12, methionine/phosphonates) n=1 Tax=hydrothermal vent metagenome TaxID=652676 RepID=A0A3B1AIA9_9ZZZZ
MKTDIMLTGILSIIVLMSPLNTPANAGTNNELLFGSVAMDIPAVMHKRLKPLTRYLSNKLGRPVSLKLSPNMGAAIKEVVDKSVDLAYLTPVAYLKAHAEGNAKIIAKTVTKGKASFQLMIVVKKDSPYKTVADLKGKTFAFGDKRALLQRAAVVGSGINLEDFSDYKFIGHYDNIARAVLNGDFDAGILKDTMAFQWQDKGLRILAETPPLPPYNITASGNVSNDMLAKLKDAFLNLDRNNPEHLKIIKAVDKKYDGFAATDDAEYNVIRKLIKPFNK